MNCSSLPVHVVPTQSCVYFFLLSFSLPLVPYFPWKEEIEEKLSQWMEGNVSFFLTVSISFSTTFGYNVFKHSTHMSPKSKSKRWERRKRLHQSAVTTSSWWQQERVSWSVHYQTRYVLRYSWDTRHTGRVTREKSLFSGRSRFVVLDVLKTEMFVS